MLVPILSTLIVFFQPGGPPPALSVQLHADRAAIAPGGGVELAIDVSIPPLWHIYHPITLDTGIGTTIEFALPPGAAAAPVRFPVPELGKMLDAEYLGYSGRVTFLTTLRLDSGYTGDSLAITAKVRGLACKEACVPVEAQGRLTLPVRGDSGPPIDAQRFDDARAALPKPLGEAPFLSGSRLIFSHERLASGASAEIIARINVQPGHHVQDRDPGVEGLIATRLFIEALDGLEFQPAVFPAAKLRKFEGLGQVREQSGEFFIRVPVKLVDANFSPRAVALRALLQYQPCTDKGQCYPPEMAEATIEFEVSPAGTPMVRSADPLVTRALSAGGASATPDRPGLWLVFLFAFLGGMILNVMPCVLPVISLKIFSFMQQAGEDHGRIFKMGLMYTVGIMASFVIVAVVMVRFQFAWGGFMQEPRYVAVLAGVVFAFALSLLGVFELRLPGIVENTAGAVTTREGYGGAFLNGLMATALATPCLGPFLGSAVGVLVQMPPVVAVAGILMVGLGLAFPYLLLTAYPAWMKYLPRPGKWMITVKQVMGFLLVATSIWLLWILQYQVDSLIPTLVFLLTLSIGCWMVGRLSLSSASAAIYATHAAALALALVGWFGGQRFFGELRPSPAGATANGAKAPADWQTWEPGLPEKLASEGHTVYVDFTAKWCLTCQANKNAVLSVDPVRSRLKGANVVLLQGDFTRYDPTIQQELNRFQRAGVPLNIVYPAGRPSEPIVLPELLTSGVVLDALKSAGPSSPRSLPREG